MALGLEIKAAGRAHFSSVIVAGLSNDYIGYLLDDPPRLARAWAALMAFVTAHGIRPLVGATFSFEEMAEAHRLMESRQSVGKIVVRAPTSRTAP